VTIDSYLTPTQRQDLLKHLSEYGTNYERYLRWASDNGLENDRIYSAAYVRKLFFRKRDIIRKITEENFKKVRRDSTMDRAKRIEALEERAHHADHRLIARIEALEAKLEPTKAVEPGPAQAAAMSSYEEECFRKTMSRGRTTLTPPPPPTWKWRPRSEEPGGAGYFIVTGFGIALYGSDNGRSTAQFDGRSWRAHAQHTEKWTHWCYLDEVPPKGFNP